MAGDDAEGPGRDGSGPDLELPSLFRRKRRGRGRADDAAAKPTSEETPAEDRVARPAAGSTEDGATKDGATEELPATSRPVGEAPTQPLRPVSGASRRPPPTPPPPVPTPAPASGPSPDTAEPAAEVTPDEPTAEVTPEEPTPPRPPRPAGPPPRPRRRGPDMTWADQETDREPDAGRVAVADDRDRTPEQVARSESTDQPGQPEDPKEFRRPEGRRGRRPSLPSVELKVPQLSPRLAAAVTGVAVALTGIVLVWLSLQACTTVRGVSTCGGVGLLAIVLTLVAQGAVGTILLGLLGVAQQRSTAVLGVGVASFVAMVLLYAGLSGIGLSAALLVVTPAAYVLAEGVTSGRLTGST